MQTTSVGTLKLVKKKSKILTQLVRNKYIYMMAIPVLLYYFIFCYGPMYGIVIAFNNYSPRMGFWGSPWVGFKWFLELFNSYYFVRLIVNTLLISVYEILWSFPAPIILALLLNEIKNKFFKRTIQTVTYLPYFISMVVVCGILLDFSGSQGVINDFVAMLGGTRQNLFGNASLFRTLYIGSGIWQNIGWGSIIFLAALSEIDPTLYEAAVIDGAGRWRQMLNITLPGIVPMIIILFILRIGSLMGVGYEKIILLYNPTTYSTADVISTFVYRKGLLENNYSYSAAIGLFNSVINLAFLITANKLSRKFTDVSLW